MHLAIKVSRLSNFLIFISRTYKGDLVKSDLRRCLLDEKISLSFYGENEDKIWSQIEKAAGKEKAGEIKKIFTSSNQVFASHWRKISKHLLLWEQHFQENYFLLQQIFVELKRLSGVKDFKISQIPIYFISNLTSNDKEIDGWFSWTPKESFIVLEIPFSLKTPNNFFHLAILAHEFFHLMLRKNEGLYSKIVNIAKENNTLLAKLAGGMPSRIFLEELLISSFIPEGYLSEKHLGIKVNSCSFVKTKNLLDWRKIVAFNLYQRAKKYTNDARQIDEDYLKEIIRVIKQNV